MKINILVFILVVTCFGCKEKYTPKPRGYFRIDFPEKKYHPIKNIYPYRFEIPNYSVIKPDDRNPDKKDWINISIPENNAEVHISYYDLSQEKKENPYVLYEFMEESRRLAYKHSIKANAINEKIYENRQNNVFGIVYQMDGNAASPMQFFITDSVKHFLRGAFYIREVPNIDSLKPVIDFLEPDVVHIIESATWN